MSEVETRTTQPSVSRPIRVLFKNAAGQIMDFGYMKEENFKTLGKDATIIRYFKDEELKKEAVTLIGLDIMTIFQPTQREWDVIIKKNFGYLQEQEAELKFGKALFDASKAIALEFLKRQNDSQKIQGNEETVQPGVPRQGAGQTIRANE